MITTLESLLYYTATIRLPNPLTSLTQKNQKYEWGVEQEEAFQILKDNLCNDPILTLHDIVTRQIKDSDVCLCKESGVKEKILVAQSEASKVESAPAEMLRGLNQQMERKEDGLLQQPGILEWKWERITMDFITKLPRYSKGYGMILVIVDRLTKSAYFLAIREDYKLEKLARLYIDEIVARHGVPVSIISDRDG
ncbi:putative reverse transcriptase domain-containing protein [Tanacetum coccineum]